MPSEAIKTLRGFRQTREFQERPVPEDVLGDILDVGRWSGSSKNTQPWNFLVVTDRQKVRRLAEIIPYGKFLPSAPVVIALVMDGPGSGQSFDAGRVAERMMVAAHAHGLGAGVATISDPSLERQAREVLGVPDGHGLGVFIALGYPAARDPNAPRRPGAGRRPLSDLVHYESFGRRRA
ncbi:MAG TPA: nitroreductase family protein [Chloroflexota bacterium]